MKIDIIDNSGEAPEECDGCGAPNDAHPFPGDLTCYESDLPPSRQRQSHDWLCPYCEVRHAEPHTDHYDDANLSSIAQMFNVLERRLRPQPHALVGRRVAFVRQVNADGEVVEVGVVLRWGAVLAVGAGSVLVEDDDRRLWTVPFEGLQAAARGEGET